MELPKRDRRPRRRQVNNLQQLIYILSAILVIALVIAISLSGKDTTPEPQLQATTPTQSSSATAPTSSSVIPPSSVITQPTTLPSETFPPTTAPPATQPGKEYIGNLYTRAELEALDSTMITYGAGSKTDSQNRPTYALSLDKQYEKYDAHFIGPDNGKVYLTYNVTYEHEGNVQKTLDILKAKNVKVVFFIDRGFARVYPDLVRQIINDGHILANHCNTHPDLPTLPIDKIVNQITNLHDYILENFGYEMRLFRPPSGYFSEQVWAIAQSLGYRSYNWSFTYLDWDTSKQPNPTSTLSKMVNALHSGAIYQLHAISSTNAAILEDFIDQARAAGYEFELLP